MLHKKSRLALYSFWIISGFCSAQNLSSIQGKVIDAKTKEPLAGAIVYLALTSIGVYAREDGSFNLENIPAGKYDFTVSMLGYQTMSKPIAFSSSTISNFIVTLEPSAVRLDSVTINARKIKQRPSDYAKFLKYFIGQTYNSYHCKILNPEDVFVYQDERRIIALASKPLQIENQALGYLVHYELKEFILDPVLAEVTISGIPRFEELIPENGKQKARWVKERDRSYFGSSQHFFRSLKEKKLASNYFEVETTDGTRLSASDLIKDSLFYYPKKIYIEFTDELPEPMYSVIPKVYSQRSQVTFIGPAVVVYDNGYFEDFHNIFIESYIGWSSTVAEMVPLGYQPTRKLTGRK